MTSPSADSYSWLVHNHTVRHADTILGFLLGEKPLIQEDRLPDDLGSRTEQPIAVDLQDLSVAISFVLDGMGDCLSLKYCRSTSHDSRCLLEQLREVRLYLLCGCIAVVGGLTNGRSASVTCAHELGGTKRRTLIYWTSSILKSTT